MDEIFAYLQFILFYNKDNNAIYLIISVIIQFNYCFKLIHINLLQIFKVKVKLIIVQIEAYSLK